MRLSSCLIGSVAFSMMLSMAWLSVKEDGIHRDHVSLLCVNCGLELVRVIRICSLPIAWTHYGYCVHNISFFLFLAKISSE